jgi:hypothetical protein
MDFDIQPSELLCEADQTIALPQKLRMEMGLLVGQFMQISGKKKLILRIGDSIDESHTCAYVSASDFHKIEGQQVEFEILDVTLGCDPEFFVMWGNVPICANTYLPFQGQIGADGNLGELRPMYALHEDEVTQNLGALIPKIRARMKRSEWATGFPLDGRRFKIEAHSYHNGMAAGFHVHMGIPPEILNTRKDFSRAAMNHLVKCLDWYVSVPLVPLEVSSGRRIGTTSYGKPGDYRPSNTTLEYRTPGGFYLRTPTLTRGMLGLCLMVAESVVSRMKAASKNFTALNKLSCTDLHDIMHIPPTNQIKSALLSKDTHEAQNHLDRIQEELSTLPTYKTHQRSVEEFFSEVRVGKAPIPDLIRNWKEADAT